MRMNKKIDDMTPQEEIEFIDEMNDSFKYYIEIIPFIEIGQEEGMQSIKLRSQIHEGKYSIAEIFFELQRMLHVYKLNNPEKKITKMIVSELDITPYMFDPNCFAPLRGVMIKMKYVTNEMFI